MSEKAKKSASHFRLSAKKTGGQLPPRLFPLAFPLAFLSAFLLVFLGGSAGCLKKGGGKKGSAKKQTAQKTAPASFKKSETFYRNLIGEPENLHPIKSSDYYSSIVQGHILESLLDRNPDTYKWEPALAEKWEISPDRPNLHLSPL